MGLKNVGIVTVFVFVTCLAWYHFTNQPTADDDTEAKHSVQGIGIGRKKAALDAYIQKRQVPITPAVVVTATTIPTTLMRDATAAIEKVRAIKAQGAVMETDRDALEAVAELQVAVRKALAEKYGAEPYVVKMKVRYWCL